MLFIYGWFHTYYLVLCPELSFALSIMERATSGATLNTVTNVVSLLVLYGLFMLCEFTVPMVPLSIGATSLSDVKMQL